MPTVSVRCRLRTAIEFAFIDHTKTDLSLTSLSATQYTGGSPQKRCQSSANSNDRGDCEKSESIAATSTSSSGKAIWRFSAVFRNSTRGPGGNGIGNSGAGSGTHSIGLNAREATHRGPACRGGTRCPSDATMSEIRNSRLWSISSRPSYRKSHQLQVMLCR